MKKYLLFLTLLCSVAAIAMEQALADARLSREMRLAAMYRAIDGDDLNLFIEQFEHGDLVTDNETGITSLMCVADAGRIKMVGFLLANGISADYVDDEGNTALMYAAAKGHDDV